MSKYRASVLLIALLFATLLAAIHSPGQISVDSGIALYEGIVGRAVGWGPTFFAAVLAWLGGGILGASIFVALNCLVTYGLLAALLTVGVSAGKVPVWRMCIAVLLAANPLFMFYVGIIWKDVMLASTAASVVGLLLFSLRMERRSALLALFASTICIAMLPLLRQQGILLAVPLAVMCAWVIARRFEGSMGVRAGLMVASLVLTLTMSAALSKAAALRVTSLPASPVSVGFLTIRAYDIVGMVAYAEPGDSSAWTGASPVAIQKMKTGYSPQRIDTLWHDADVRGYINSMSAEQSAQVWRNGIKQDPQAYLTHRARAFEALIGAGPMTGCVPAYWGVAAVPEHLSALGVAEEMDPRDRFIGGEVKLFEPTMVFRHWWYAALLLIATVLLLRGSHSTERWILRVAALVAWLYLGSFVPTTIACDFRYLYPVSFLSTLICIYMLVHPQGRQAVKGEVATSAQ